MFFETYRFSEDLDFTVRNPAHLDVGFLSGTFAEIAEWVYDASGLEMPRETHKFKVFNNPRGRPSAQGRVGYRGPLGRVGDPPRMKLDLAAARAKACRISTCRDLNGDIPHAICENP
jgi:hypothetical protein